MSRELIDPIKVNFSGRDADKHRMDAVLLGQSISGIARIYNAVGHYHFHAQIRSSEHSEIRVQVGPPEPGSIFYLLYMFMVHGKMAVYPELLFAMAELAVPAFVSAMIAKKTGQTELLEKSLDIIDRQNQRSFELARAQQEIAGQREDRLLNIIEKLVDNNRGPLSDMAAPVGKTVNELVQIPNNSEAILIDAPIAESLRSPEEVTVGDIEEKIGFITALDTKNGQFKFEDAVTGKEFRGKITDPSLNIPQNVYSRALDTKNRVVLTVKPTIRESGEIHKLFASDAKNAD